jgi:abortive infection bacteriophage resistance protein
MNPLSIEEQVNRQIEKGCLSNKQTIKKFLKTSSYYTINYSYEKYLYHNGSLKDFKVKDYLWLEKTNERIAKESLSLLLRVERIIRNRIADLYSFYCKDNNFDYFSVESFVVDSHDYIDITTDDQKDSFKSEFIDECWDLYQKKKSLLDRKYYFDNIENVPPFVIAQHLSFGKIRTFFKLLHKSIKQEIANDFYLKISEFNYLIEKLNYLRNACAHGDFILDFHTLKRSAFVNTRFHKYVYCNDFILNRNKIALIPTLSLCAYILNDDINFYLSTMRNILEMVNYNNRGSINSDYLNKSLGIKSNCKTIQKKFR